MQCLAWRMGHLCCGYSIISVARLAPARTCVMRPARCWAGGQVSGDGEDTDLVALVRTPILSRVGWGARR